jgi:hypothetical protein
MAKYENLNNFVKQQNQQARLFGSGEEFVLPRDADEIKQLIEVHLSPENLTCDGELSHKEVMRRSKILKAALNELEELITA